MPPELQTLRIIWFAFVASITVFQIILLFMGLPQVAPEWTLGGIFAVCALGPAAFGVFGVPLFLRNTVAQSAFIVRFACFESVAMFGFIAAIVANLPALSLGMAVVAWALLASVFPTEERYTAWELRRLGEPDP